MQHHWVVPMVAAAANSVICVLVLRGGLRRPITRTFAWMTLTTILWNLDIFTLYYFVDAEPAEFWSRIFRTGMVFAPAALLHATLVQSESEGVGWRRALRLSYAVSFALAVANLHGDLVSGVRRHAWGWYIEPTRLYAVMTALIAIDVPLALQRVWHAHRHPSSSRQRVQAKFWFLAALVQTPFIVTNLLPIYGFNIYPLGSLGNVFTMSIMAYAIARHRLMDVDYVVRKGVSFTLAATLVLVPGGLAMWSVATSMRWHEPAVMVCTAMTLALLSVVLVPALQNAFETRVQRALFPQYFDYRRRLRNLATALVHMLDEHALVRRLGSELAEVLDVETCQVFVVDEGTRRLTSAYPEDGSCAPVPEDASHALEAFTGPVLASELEAAGEPVAELFRSRRWEVVIPLRIQDRLKGLIALSRNREFRIFSGEDLQLLASVAAGASVALENATLSHQLRRSEAVLERANRLSSLGLLAAGIAHEIRNPLVAVKTFLDLLPQRLEDHDFLTKFRDLSLGELRRVTDLIADLLALGKSKTAERRALDVVPTLEPVVRLMESTARKRQIEVIESHAPDLPPIWADPDQLKQIVLNLLLNAIESSPPGAHVRLDVRRAAEDGVVLEVRDDGPGIPREQLETIFHPFFTTKETGTGLGLTLVHQMVVEHGGEIMVASEVGRGSRFQVMLPGTRTELAATGS